MKPFQILVVSAAAAVMSITTPAVLAQANSDHHGKAAEAKSGTSKDMTEGEVRKIDKDTGKLTIKHEEIKNLSMPPMTMVFQVKEKALLDKVKTGDKIKFSVVNEHGKMLVTEIELHK